jgi:hypothetical protein
MVKDEAILDVFEDNGIRAGNPTGMGKASRRAADRTFPRRWWNGMIPESYGDS